MPPKFIKPFLWSADFNKIDLQRDSDRIILNLLNNGTKKATDWLFNYYPEKKIKKAVINHGAKGELSAKSLNYWALVLKINPRQLAKNRA
ncbi:MAG: hypothetical protein PHO56_05005 [Patescibacteria group bacterium]|nr:hypothetical protein [Patescibacteria group bacterium]